jgi:high-affinity Fe2+/Pb2+ permease
MELKQIKRNIWFILAIIGTSCGMIGGWFMYAVKGYETGDWFSFWSGVVTVVGMVLGLIGWGIKLIAECKKYFKQKGVVKNGTERNPKDTRPQ